MKYLVKVRKGLFDYQAVEFTNKGMAMKYAFIMNRRGFYTKITKVE